MFDTIRLDKVVRCSCGYRPKDFQTKSLSQTLDYFKIVKNCLYKQECQYRMADRSEQRQCGKIWLPLSVAYNCKWVKSTYDGTIEMYDYCSKCKQLINVYVIVVNGEVKAVETKAVK
jgi:hypothetical protein